MRAIDGRSRSHDDAADLSIDLEGLTFLEEVGNNVGGDADEYSHNGMTSVLGEVSKNFVTKIDSGQKSNFLNPNAGRDITSSDLNFAQGLFIKKPYHPDSARIASLLSPDERPLNMVNFSNNLREMEPSRSSGGGHFGDVNTLVKSETNNTDPSLARINFETSEQENKLLKSLLQEQKEYYETRIRTLEAEIVRLRSMILPKTAAASSQPSVKNIELYKESASLVKKTNDPHRWRKVSNVLGAYFAEYNVQI